MAKTHPHNLTGAVDALDSDVKSIRAADTAYTVANAADYDAKRTVEPRDKKIHVWVLGHTTRDAKIMEVGCGTGRLLSEGLKAGYFIDGVDGSGPMLEHLKAKLDEQQRQQLELIVAQASELRLGLHHSIVESNGVSRIRSDGD